MSAYPKIDGDKLTTTEYNCLKCMQSTIAPLIETELENSINITRLQYCKGLVDVAHDYMVVDAFTDSTGYNNSVNTGCTTSTYCCTGVTGYYISKSLESFTYPTYCVLNSCCCFSGCASYSTAGNTCAVYDFYSRASSSSGSSGYYTAACAAMQVCSLPLSISSDVESFCLTFYACQYGRESYCYGGTGMAAISFSTPYDTWNKSSSGGCCSNCIQMCYCFVRIPSTCNWCFYSGWCCFNCFRDTTTSCCCYSSAMAFRCCVAITEYPKFCSAHNAMSESGGTNECGSSRAYFGIQDAKRYSYACTHICTVPYCFICPVKTIYFTEDKYGTGTNLLNIKNATDCSIIASCLEPNTFYNLNTCSCCHTYEIIQCNDAVSCIKSYAIAVGV